MATSNSTPSTRSTRAPKGAIAALPADLSNVIPFNKAKRAAQIADERAANGDVADFRCAEKGAFIALTSAHIARDRKHAHVIEQERPADSAPASPHIALDGHGAHAVFRRKGPG